jgi:hypothetical protein
MDRLGAELAGLAEEAAGGARAAGAAAARRRGARRRRHQAAATVLLIVGVVAGLAWFKGWTASSAPPIAPAPPTSAPPQTSLRWYPFDPKNGDPGLHPRGKPVLIAQRAFASRPYQVWAFQATLASKPGLQICVAVQAPGGGGGSGCEPAAWPAGIGTTAIGDRVQLLDGHVSKRARLVRLELARAGVPLPPMLVRPLSGGPHLPVNVWVATTGRTVEVRRVALLDAAGRQIGSGPGLPASDDLLPPAGPVTVLGYAPSATGPLRVAAYEAEAAFTCIQVIPDQRPGDGFVKCAPPPPARRPALEADGICSAGAAILYGTAPRTARQIWIEVTGATPVNSPAFDAGGHFGRAYWAATVPNHAKVTQVVALDDRGAVVAHTTPRSRASC